MATREQPWAPGTPSWADLGVDDLAAARLFYEGLFGWEFADSPPEAGGYLMALKHGKTAAGIGPKMSANQPSAWTTYLATDDLNASMAAIGTNGGQVLTEELDVMGLGKMALGLDPGGAAFGLWQAITHVGAQIVNQPGTMIWNENMSRSWNASKEFYVGLFDYGLNDMSADGFSYAALQVGGADVAGIGALSDDTPADQPAAWNVYFAVDDTDEAVDQAVKLGGDVIAPPSDSPYGRLATLADPDGARFLVMAAPPEGYPVAAAE